MINNRALNISQCHSVCKTGIQWTTYDKNNRALNISQCHSVCKKGIQWTTYDKTIGH